MRELQKYEAFYTYWLYFMQSSNPMRVSDLLTFHAEYKFFLRDVKSARELLLEALDLNEENTRARLLLQVLQYYWKWWEYYLIKCEHFYRHIENVRSWSDNDDTLDNLVHTPLLRQSFVHDRKGPWLRSLESSIHSLENCNITIVRTIERGDVVFGTDQRRAWKKNVTFATYRN